MTNRIESRLARLEAEQQARQALEARLRGHPPLDELLEQFPLTEAERLQDKAEQTRLVAMSDDERGKEAWAIVAGWSR